MPIHKQLRQKVQAAESDSGVVSDDSITRTMFDCGTVMRKFVDNRWLSGVVTAFADGVYEVNLDAPEGLKTVMIPEDEMEDLVQLAQVRVGAKIWIHQPNSDAKLEATVTGERLFQTRSFYIEYRNGNEEWMDLSKTTFTLETRTELRRIARENSEPSATLSTGVNPDVNSIKSSQPLKDIATKSAPGVSSQPSAVMTKKVSEASTMTDMLKSAADLSKAPPKSSKELMKMVEQGSFIEIYWPDEQKYHRARVGKITGRKYHLYYLDEEAHEWVKLSNHIFRVIDEPSGLEEDEDKDAGATDEQVQADLKGGGAQTSNGASKSPDTSNQTKSKSFESEEEDDLELTELELKLKRVEVGTRLAVYWDGEDRYFQGTVTEIRRDRYHVDYDDGENTWEILKKSQFLLLDDESLSPRATKRKGVADKKRGPGRPPKKPRTNSTELGKKRGPGRPRKYPVEHGNGEPKKRGPARSRKHQPQNVYLADNDDSASASVDSESKNEPLRKRSPGRPLKSADFPTKRGPCRPQKEDTSKDVSPKKRRPGRSRKDENASAEIPVKHGRGRPRKSEKDPTASPLQLDLVRPRRPGNSDRRVDSPVKRAPGRPRKSENVNEAGSPERVHGKTPVRDTSTTPKQRSKSVLDASDSDSDSDAPAKPVKRGPGRPRKSETSVSAKKRGPGRPRKREAQEESRDVSGEFPVGTRVAVFWPLDSRYYRATVSNIDTSRVKSHFLEYDDGEKEWVDFADHEYRVIKKPAVAAVESKPRRVPAPQKLPTSEPEDDSDDDDSGDDESVHRFNLEIEAKSRPGDALRVRKGAKVAVWWPDDRTYYVGTIKKIRSFLDCKKPHRIMYDDGEDEWIDLQDHKFRELRDGESIRKSSRLELDSDSD